MSRAYVGVLVAVFVVSALATQALGWQVQSAAATGVQAQIAQVQAGLPAGLSLPASIVSGPGPEPAWMHAVGQVNDWINAVDAACWRQVIDVQAKIGYAL